MLPPSDLQAMFSWSQASQLLNPALNNTIIWAENASGSLRVSNE